MSLAPHDGRQTSITQGANVTSYTYDGLDRRLSRTSGGTTTNFLYDGGQILLEKQGSTTTATYTYGNALVRKDGETPLFDGLGSERTVTSSTQVVTGTLTLDGFGNQVASTGSSANPYMFAATSGYRNDGDAGLTHVGARYYDAQVGRFTTRDTKLNQRPYLYCRHDPVNKTDRSGHEPDDVFGPIVVASGDGWEITYNPYNSEHPFLVHWDHVTLVFDLDGNIIWPDRPIFGGGDDNGTTITIGGRYNPFTGEWIVEVKVKGKF